MNCCPRCGWVEEPVDPTVWYDNGADWTRTPEVQTPTVFDDEPTPGLLGPDGQPLRARRPMGFAAP